MSSDRDPYKRLSENYDLQNLRYQWHGPALLFGIMYPHLSPGETVLDLGIGTGLGALSFHKAGLRIIGIDNSPSMIEQCVSRGLNWTIHQHDLARTPWPIQDTSVNHVVCAGVTHFIRDLQVVMGEVSRVLRDGGLFGFDFYEYHPEDGTAHDLVDEGIYETRDEEYDIHLYRHTEPYVKSLLSENGFSVLSDTEFLASREPRKYFRTIVARLQCA